MAMSEPLDILLAHNHWATRNVLDTCAKLTPEQFHQKFPIGLGSLHDNLAHIIGAMWVWTQVLKGNGAVPGLPEIKGTPGELLMKLDEVAAEFDDAARAGALDAVVTRIREGKAHKFTRGGVLMQVLTHGVHHRAQCINMLRQLGVSPLPQSSVIEWIRAVDPVV